MSPQPSISSAEPARGRRQAPDLTEHPDNELAALALRLQRACGLRIGELLDLELDCVHEIDGNGA